MRTKKKMMLTLVLVLVVIWGSIVIPSGTRVYARSTKTLTYFVAMDGKVAASYTSFAQMAVYQIIMKKFGVKINFIHPPMGNEADQFNLMIASKKLPDIIEWNWANYPGGPIKAVEDKVVIPLNKYLDKYAPNYKKYLQKDPEARKLITTDRGEIISFAFVREKQWQGVYWGPQLRADWLKKLGLNPPETVDEWYKVLKAFKTKDPNGNGKLDEIPFSNAATPSNTFSWQGFIVGAWGIIPGFYQENGKVKYGVIQPQFKQFAETIRKWYKEGLLDPGMLAPDSKRWEAKILNNEIGSWVGLGGGNLARFLNIKRNQEHDNVFDIVAVQYPTLKKGETPEFGQMDFRAGPGGAAITTQCKDIPLAMRILDWGYSKEGYMTFNFGILGKTYKLNEKGEPQYTDEILKNPKLDPLSALARYGRASFSGPFVQSEYYSKQLITWPQQYNAAQVWAKSSNKKRLPPLSFLPDEASRLANIMNRINTYYSEMFDKYVAGRVSNIDTLVNTIKKMGIDEAIKIYQQAYNRYLKR